MLDTSMELMAFIGFVNVRLLRLLTFSLCVCVCSDRVCQQQGLSLWVPFQNAATAVTNLYKESLESHQRSYELGVQRAYQRRNKDMLAWVKKRRRNIRREDLISFLCGKAPPHATPSRRTDTQTRPRPLCDVTRQAAVHGERVVCRG
uniref:Uncharacterized protein n=1 Tax=Oncorhynchus tshawytscha TaxID=74940 RepID=A0AAZ3R5A3_ONCTS